VIGVTAIGAVTSSFVPFWGYDGKEGRKEWGVARVPTGRRLIAPALLTSKLVSVLTTALGGLQS
jgi:hypothetical protein